MYHLHHYTLKPLVNFLCVYTSKIDSKFRYENVRRILNLILFFRSNASEVLLVWYDVSIYACAERCEYWTQSCSWLVYQNYRSVSRELSLTRSAQNYYWKAFAAQVIQLNINFSAKFSLHFIRNSVNENIEEKTSGKHFFASTFSIYLQKIKPNISQPLTVK